MAPAVDARQTDALVAVVVDGFSNLQCVLAAPYLDFFAGSAGRATPHGSYFCLGSGILSIAAL
jgi:hypothetical protein